MKTLEQIKEEVYNSLSDIFTIDFLDVLSNNEDIQKVVNEIAQRYATEYAKEALRLASENAKTGHGYFSDGSTSPVMVVDKHSVLSENNLPKHR